jgi:hypothetical protein
MKRIAPLLLAACSLTLVACWHLAVGPSSPRPNVVIAQGKAPSALVLAPAIADDFVIAKTGSVNEVPVRGWRHTLESGFKSAFPTPGDGRKLELMEAELSFAPAAVGMGGTAAVWAQIRFKARAVDASGNELGVLAGTVKAKEANVSATEAGMTENASKAVESLFEVLTAELLSKL